MIQQVKLLRVKVDGLGKLVDEDIYEEILCEEAEKAYDSLLLGKAWLGKILGHIGENTPYINDGNRKSVGDIEPAADMSKGLKFGFKEGKVIISSEDVKWSTEAIHDPDIITQKVDVLREEVKKIVTDIENLDFESRNRELAIARTQAYVHLSEARFWLGFLLRVIRDVNQS